MTETVNGAADGKPSAQSPTHCHDHVISLDQVSFGYEGRQVIDSLSFAVLQRDFIGLIGSNGAGKTTLLKMIVGLLTPHSGEIRLFNQPLSQFKDWERIGYVPQKNSLNPLFPATVKEVVMSGLYGKKKMYRRLTADDNRKCEEALQMLGIEELASRRIGKLSGGQQQRVFLARSLINNPDLLILDEPTVGIDIETQEAFFHMIKHMHQRHQITFVMVSHDIEMMKSYLGESPKQTSGKLKFYIKHSHELDDCVETDLSHTLKHLHHQLDHQHQFS
jgi:zinc transport system ATP-binding protein